jgi:glycosyltransferase involved in cell wall biosynthesis
MEAVPPTVSVIVPTFNRRDVLPRALDSVLKQRGAGLVELIVVDDGSTDETAALVRADYPQARLLRQENRGVSAARNVGIQAAQGEWIALLDSDDYWLEGKLARQLTAIAEQPELRLCHTEEIWIRNGVRVNPMKKHQKSGGSIYQRCLPLCCISPSSVLIHRTVFDEVGLFDETLPACEDYDLWLRVCAREAVLFLDEPLLVKTGGHEDQLSRKYWGMDRFRIRALEKILVSERLTPSDREATLSLLVRKLEILLNGAKKRDNRELLAAYTPNLDAALALIEGRS